MSEGMQNECVITMSSIRAECYLSGLSSISKRVRPLGDFDILFYLDRLLSP